MTILLSLLKSNWKHLIIIAALVGVTFMAYNYVYQKGYSDRIQEYESNMKEKIEKIEHFSQVTLEQMLIANERTTKDIKGISKKVITYNLTSAPCVPTTEFVTGYNEIIKRANK